MQSMGGKASPQWNDHLLTGEAHLMFCELPVGWTGDWHENPKPQWIVVVSGRWFVETMDGTRAEMGPGDVSFGGDQGCKDPGDGKVGHRSGTVGDEPAKLMLVQLGPKWSGAKPGAFD
ncbi:cupin domain-containing protein [Methyloligella sp. GL2]|nr:cupin domain-containing protein [Methyloligella sp. GL2]